MTKPDTGERESRGTSPSPGIVLQWPCICSHSSWRRDRSGTDGDPGAEVEVDGEERYARCAHMKEGKHNSKCPSLSLYEGRS